MEFTLVNGRYTKSEAAHLLTQLVRVKTDFHHRKIDTIHQSEEDIKHSERRIQQLEEELRRTLEAIKVQDYQNVALSARVTIEFVPVYQHA